MRRRRTAVLLAAGVCAILLAGCANIPTGGGVSKLTIDSKSGDTALLSLPEAPVKDATQQEILEGFIKAGRGPQLNYQVAREFLTGSFRSKWNPNAGALVSSSPIAPTSGGDRTLEISISVSATVGADGRYTTQSPAQTKQLQFRFEKDAGQWRISSAPDGTILPPSRFTATFHDYDLFFFDPTFQYLVPDKRWFADSSQVATRIVKGLLQGPPEGLGGALVSAFPTGTEVTGAPTIDSARATVDMSSQVSSESAIGKRRMTQQLTQSLSGLGIASASITVGGFPVTVTDGPEPDHFESVLQDPVGFSRGAFGALVGATVRPLPAIGSAVDKLNPTGAAVGRNGDQVAVLNGAGVSVVRGAAPAALLDSRPGLVTPSLDPEGFVWSVPQSKPNAILAYDSANKPHPVPLGLDGLVVSMAVSRDGTRLLLAVQTSSGPKLVVAGILRDKDLVPTSLAQPSYLPIDSSPLLSASWVDSGTVVVLSQDGASSAVTSYDLGGVTHALGTVDGGTAVVGGNGSDGIRVLDASGAVYALSGAFGWQDTGINASFLASQQ